MIGKGKRCPDCKKRISPATAMCRHCGSRIQELLLRTDPIVTAPPSSPAYPTHAMKILLWILAIGAAAVGSTFLIRRDGASSSAPSGAQSGPATAEPAAATPPWPVYRTTAAELYNNYAAYEAATNQKTGRTAIEISGIIKAIDRNLFDESEIDLEAGEGSRSVALTLDKSPLDSAESLVQGRYVRIRCENMSFIQGSPSGQSCQLVE
jgi:hypothetical protein